MIENSKDVEIGERHFVIKIGYQTYERIREIKTEGTDPNELVKIGGSKLIADFRAMLLIEDADKKNKKAQALIDKHPELNSYLLKSQKISAKDKVEIVSLALKDPSLSRDEIAEESPLVMGGLYNEILLLWAALGQEDSKVPN